MAGCGKMGGAMLSSWVEEGAGTFVAVDPGEPRVPQGVRHEKSRDALGTERFDALVVAVKPQMLDDVLPPYEAQLEDGGFALSIAAGVAAKRVSEKLGGAPVIRVMPNLPAAIGRGVSALYAGEGVTDAHKAAATRLVEATGTAVWLEDEDQIDRFTAVAGSGPGYVFEILRSYVEAAKGLGFDEATAREMVFGTVLGTTEMAQREGRPLDELRNDVTSPNGTTQAGLDQLRKDGLLEGLMEETLRAAYDRAVELR
ncbi:pyrroline-5-carboxylate reductase family protein [Parvularcula dongshanensis]|nr:pyrroline-5-carboxylate reductase [Parvularcula dongshanensis]